MKYIKTFEAKKKDRVLYENPDFRIVISSNDSFSYNSRWLATSGILSMAMLIQENSKYLDDKELRDVELRQKDIDSDTSQLDDLETNVTRNYNIMKYHSSLINGFFGKHDKKFIDSVPDDVYMDLTFKYYPLMSEAIKKSKTLGDVIDNFRIIYNEIIPDLEFKMEMYKYNL